MEGVSVRIEEYRLYSTPALPGWACPEFNAPFAHCLMRSLDVFGYENDAGPGSNSIFYLVIPFSDDCRQRAKEHYLGFAFLTRNRDPSQLWTVPLIEHDLEAELIAVKRKGPVLVADENWNATES